MLSLGRYGNVDHLQVAVEKKSKKQKLIRKASEIFFLNDVSYSSKEYKLYN